MDDISEEAVGKINELSKFREEYGSLFLGIRNNQLMHCIEMIKESR